MQLNAPNLWQLSQLALVSVEHRNTVEPRVDDRRIVMRLVEEMRAAAIAREDESGLGRRAGQH